MTPHERLAAMCTAMGNAGLILSMAEDVMREYVAEAAKMESVGPTLAPGLYLDPERQLANEAVLPMVSASLEFLAAAQRGREILEAAQAKKGQR